MSQLLVSFANVNESLTKPSVFSAYDDSDNHSPLSFSEIKISGNLFYGDDGGCEEAYWRGENSVIYRGIMRRGGESHAMDIVLKCSLDDDLDTQAKLVREAGWYANQLKDLQGVTVPKYYGLYHGIGPHGQEVVCLLLEDCGMRVPYHFTSLEPKDFRISIINQLIRLHDAGVIYEHLDESQVVQREGVFKLIDFQTAEPHDQACNFKYRPRAEEPRPPEYMKDGCWRMWRTCREFDIWNNDNIRLSPLLSRKFVREDGLPDQDVIDRLYPKECIFYSNIHVEKALCNYYKAAQVEIDRGASIDRLVANRATRFMESLGLQPADTRPSWLRPIFSYVPDQQPE